MIISPCILKQSFDLFSFLFDFPKGIMKNEDDRVTKFFFDTTDIDFQVCSPLQIEQLPLCQADICRLVGAPARSRVVVEKIFIPRKLGEPEDEVLQISVFNDFLIQDAIVRHIIVENGEDVIFNKAMAFHPEFRGFKLGVRCFAIEVREAVRLGTFGHIKVLATGNAKSASDRNDKYALSGHIIWPRLGFNGPIPYDVRKKLPEGLKWCKTISNLMQLEDGIKFWDEHGDQCLLEFSLDDGYSRNTLRSYLSTQNIEV